MSDIQLKNRRQLFGVEIDALTMRETVAQVFAWIAAPESTCRFIVTPNVDHIVQVQSHAGLQQAYRDAALVVTDGRPVLWAANLLGETVPETVPGSDLVPAIFSHAQTSNTPITVFLLGAMPGVADRAKANIHSAWASVRVVGTLSPDFGFEKDEAQCQKIIDMINTVKPDVLVLGLGAPKQELWVTKHASKIAAKVALCVGATIDFMAGEKPRAPIWMRKVGLEWLHRLCSEPRRLAKRYFVDAIIFPKLVFKEWLRKRAV